MGVIFSGFLARSNSWHVATDTVGERMDGMRHILVNHFVTHQTLLRTGSFGLKLSRGYAQLMNIVTGGTGDTFSGVGGKLPTEILLVVSFDEIASKDVFKVPVVVTRGFKVQSQCSAGLVEHRPFDILHLGRLAAAVAGAANLCPKARREMRRVNDGQSFVKDSLLGQRHVVGTGTVASLAADARFRERLCFKINAHGVATRAILDPRAFIPVIFVIIDPTVSQSVVCNRSDIENPVLFD